MQINYSLLLSLGLSCLVCFQPVAHANSDKQNKQPTIHVNTLIEGEMPQEINDWLNKIINSSELVKEKHKNIDFIKLKTKSEEATLLKALQSKGYYNAKVRGNLQINEHQVALAKFEIKPGNIFKIKSIEIQAGSHIHLPDSDELGLKKTEAIEAAKVLLAEKLLRQAIEKKNCLPHVEVDYKAILNYDTEEATVIFYVKDYPQAKFGETFFEGLTSVKANFLERKLMWKQGDCFKSSLVEKMRSAYLTAGLFGNVETSYVDYLDENGEIPVHFKFTERLHRTIKLGIGYGTDEGIGLGTTWENRNYFGEGETLKLDVKLNSIQKQLEGKFTEPYFFRPDQSLVLSSKILRETAEAYDSNSLSVSAAVRRKLKRHWIVSLGSGYSVSKVTYHNTGEKDETFGLLSFPIGAIQDTRDDLLNPKKGHRLNLEWTAFFDTFYSGVSFYKTYLDGSKYYSFGHDDRMTFAVRGAIGSIVGAPLMSIPADERFYAGGSNSVRGYAYQKLGPFLNGDPTGGRSLIEISLEQRMRFTEKIGGVFFVDGGNAYEAKYPDFSDAVRWAVGTGLRYYTGFGPIRFDIAFPIHRRHGVDAAYQYYISLGQAF